MCAEPARSPLLSTIKAQGRTKLSFTFFCSQTNIYFLFFVSFSFSDMVGGTVSSRRARGGGGVFNKLQKRNGGRGDEFTVREGGGTVRSLAGLRFQFRQHSAL